MTHSLLEILRIGSLDIQPYHHFQTALESVETLIVADFFYSSLQVHKFSCIVLHTRFLNEPCQLVSRLLSILGRSKLTLGCIDEFLPRLDRSFPMCLHQVLPPQSSCSSELTSCKTPRSMPRLGRALVANIV